jgi:glyoxylase-like metal-dependent hydrolase (beta-lactamase superfamily II)
MPEPICVRCGVQYEEDHCVDEGCFICQDEREAVLAGGQRWTTIEAMRATHANAVTATEPGVVAIRTQPLFAITQQAYLIQTPAGNVLWDCISYLDRPTIDLVTWLGGISAIALSHPHLHGSMQTWSAAFGNVPIYIHADSRVWTTRPQAPVHFWEGETRIIAPGVTLIRTGGQFPGSTVLHWERGGTAANSLFTGDEIYPVEDKRYVSFLYSFPNLLPMNAASVRRIIAAITPFEFETLSAAWPGHSIATGAKEAVIRSAERYISHLL